MHERRGKGAARLLAVSHPNRPLLDHDQAVELLGRYHDGPGRDDRPAYHDGIVSSTHTPRHRARPARTSAPDRFHNPLRGRSCPIDGFGQPRIFLALLRQICSNGAIGYARAFRSDIRIGEDAVYTLDRPWASSTTKRDLRRYGSASSQRRSPGRRFMRPCNCTGCSPASGSPGRPTRGNSSRLCGDLHALYGLANLESLSVKRQRMLPARCRVYDLLNFASEIATHRATAESRPRLQAYIGTLVSDEYDLEGTAEKVPEFKYLFLNLNLAEAHDFENYGSHPVSNQRRRASLRNEAFMSSAATVARPILVRPTIVSRSPSQRKCRAQAAVRGLKRGTLWPVCGSVAATRSPFARLHAAQASALFQRASDPPIAVGTICSRWKR